MTASATRSFGFGWPPLIGIGATLAIALVGALPPRHEPPPAIVSSASLRFLAQADGGLHIVTAGSGQLVEAIPAEGDNFIRGLSHAMSTVRTRYRIDPAAPYRLTNYSDGRLVLTDPGTKSAIDIESFGVTNTRAFLALLPQGGPGR